jgi:acetylglutamate kinase
MTSKAPIIVIKFGGNAMTSPDLFTSFARDIQKLGEQGFKLVIVHGGGPQISNMLSRLNIESEFRGGLRVTTPEVASVVATVLTGEVQRTLVTALNLNGVAAVGVSGEDSKFLTSTKLVGQEFDLGLVGKIEAIDPRLIEVLLENAYVPVVSPVSSDEMGVSLNVNADTVAGSLAGALGAVRLILMTDVNGVLADYPDPKSLISELTVVQVEQLLPEVTEGMIPKLESVLHAIRHGCASVQIVNGSTEHSLMNALAKDAHSGTVITK